MVEFVTARTYREFPFATEGPASRYWTLRERNPSSAICLDAECSPFGQLRLDSVAIGRKVGGKKQRAFSHREKHADPIMPVKRISGL